MDAWQGLLLAAAPSSGAVETPDMDKHIFSTLLSCLSLEAGLLDGFPLEQKLHIVAQLFAVVIAVFDSAYAARLSLSLLAAVQDIDVSSEDEPVQESWLNLAAACLLRVSPEQLKEELQRKNLELNVKRRLWKSTSRAWISQDNAAADSVTELLGLPLWYAQVLAQSNSL